VRHVRLEAGGPSEPPAPRETGQAPASPVVVERDDVADVYRALVLGTGDYIRKNGFQRVTLGLSGGIDSSLVAAIAADALGAESVTGVILPSRYTSESSRSDAIQLADALGVRTIELSIEPTFVTALETLAP